MTRPPMASGSSARSCDSRTLTISERRRHTGTATDRLGRTLQPVTAATWNRQFTVDAMGAALMISEFVRYGGS